MTTYKIEDKHFKCDMRTILTCKHVVDEQKLRTYMTKNWETITKGLDNSTILFLCGVHGGKDGSIGGERNIQWLKNQVFLQFSFN